VVEDFHFASLKQTINGLVIAPNTDDRRLILVKLKTSKIKETVDRVGKLYAANASGYPFEYSFLDERFNTLYKTETKQQQLLTVFSIIAIVIACLGLFGLASYTAVKRTREIGVRKVLGSSVENIVLLLSKDLLKPVLLGALIAVPAGYYAMHQWLEGFAYRINIDWWLFALAALTAMVIAMITVSYQAIKAALANPVKSLRTE
jgi:putative ABC transport system permease protein